MPADRVSLLIWNVLQGQLCLGKDAKQGGCSVAPAPRGVVQLASYLLRKRSGKVQASWGVLGGLRPVLSHAQHLAHVTSRQTLNTEVTISFCAEIISAHHLKPLISCQAMGRRCCVGVGCGQVRVTCQPPVPRGSSTEQEVGKRVAAVAACAGVSPALCTQPSWRAEESLTLSEPGGGYQAVRNDHLLLDICAKNSGAKCRRAHSPLLDAASPG